MGQNSEPNPVNYNIWFSSTGHFLPIVFCFESWNHFGIEEISKWFWSFVRIVGGFEKKPFELGGYDYQSHDYQSPQSFQQRTHGCGASVLEFPLSICWHRKLERYSGILVRQAGVHASVSDQVLNMWTLGWSLAGNKIDENRTRRLSSTVVLLYDEKQTFEKSVATVSILRANLIQLLQVSWVSNTGSNGTEHNSRKTFLKIFNGIWFCLKYHDRKRSAMWGWGRHIFCAWCPANRTTGWTFLLVLFDMKKNRGFFRFMPIHRNHLLGWQLRGTILGGTAMTGAPIYQWGFGTGCLKNLNVYKPVLKALTLLIER